MYTLFSVPVLVSHECVCLLPCAQLSRGRHSNFPFSQSKHGASVIVVRIASVRITVNTIFLCIADSLRLISIRSIPEQTSWLQQTRTRSLSSSVVPPAAKSVNLGVIREASGWTFVRWLAWLYWTILIIRVCNITQLRFLIAPLTY